MRVEKQMQTDISHDRNSFGQIITSYDNNEHVTVTGTLEELVEYSKEHPVYLARSEQTEHFFQKWDSDSKYVIIAQGEVWYYTMGTYRIDGRGWYVHKGVIA